MMQQISQHDLEHVYANAVNTIQSQMNFVDAVKELEEAARAGHGKAAMFLAELYYQGRFSINIYLRFSAKLTQ